jgi:3-deoxy-7-phosphoheptulonate synthase
MMVETHPCPEEAWSDGPQSLTFEEFSRMMKDLEPYIDLWKQSRPAPVAAEA